MYNHVSVWLHESYEGYGSLKKILHYDQMSRCYGVTGSRGKKTYIYSSKHPCTVILVWLHESYEGYGSLKKNT